MSEVLKPFIFEGTEVDVCFDKSIINLYVVIDKLSGVRVSGFIPAANDFIAIVGFKDFGMKNKEKGDVNVYELIRIGSYSEDNNKFLDFEKYKLVDSRADLDKLVEECKNYILANEE